MKIGYQGIVGSNAEEAARLFGQKQNASDIEYIPLVDSKSVIDSLKRQEIDLAVVATKNSIGGTVSETYEVLRDQNLQLVGTEILPIHHCLFKHPDTPQNEITEIASHIQALKQTEHNRRKYFPNCEEREEADTALAAKLLADGVLPRNIAVLCRKNAGEENNLMLVMENMEDTNENKTEFRILKLPDIDYTNSERPSIWETIKYNFASESGATKLAQLIMFLGIVVAIYLSTAFNQSPWEAALTVGGYGTILIVFFTSTNFRLKSRYNTIVGYWKYYSLSNNVDEYDKEQMLSTPRIVRIFELDGKLKMEGFICDKENVPFFESKEDIFVSLSGKCRGGLVYFYGPPSTGVMRTAVGGIAHLEWVTKYPATTVNKMEGEYFGSISKDAGMIRYLRITEEEYHAHMINSFL